MACAACWRNRASVCCRRGWSWPTAAWTSRAGARCRRCGTGFVARLGLAAVFPRTALFAGYNLTHLPADGTYEVGMINGAFMLGRREFLAELAGPGGAVFDEQFFMYGDDIDLCIRVGRAGRRIVYDGRVRITHLKGVSVAKEFASMSAAIFDANRDVYLKHFGSTALARWKWRMAFGAWKTLARWRAKLRGSRPCGRFELTQLR
jgi:N-acetylglucosaminyl-diphospho-decaprenol L-rhamnosyltransferase